MNKKQFSILLLLAVAINSATAQVVTYKNNAEGVRQARRDVLNAIKNKDLKQAEEIIKQIGTRFDASTRQLLTSELQKAKLTVGTATISDLKTEVADLQKRLTQTEGNYQSLLLSYQGAESQTGNASKSVADIQQRVDAAKQEHDRLKAENEHHKRTMANLESSTREAHALLAQRTHQLAASKEEVAALQKELSDAKSAQDANAAARIQADLNAANQKVAEAQQEQQAAVTDVNELQKQLAQNKSALDGARTAIDAAHTKVASLTNELRQKEEALLLAQANLMQKQAALDEANARLNARYALETEAALAKTKPSDLRNIIAALLQPNNSASIAVALPIALTNSDAAFHNVAEIASSNIPVQTQLKLLAEDNQDKDNIYQEEIPKYSDESKRAQWIIVHGAKNDQKWAQDALLTAREQFTYKDVSDREQLGVRQPKWAQDALIVLSPDKEFAFNYVISALESPIDTHKNLSQNALKAFAIDQANKRNERFQKYIAEKAVYASWKSILNTDYGVWALCALKLAAENKERWALDILADMLNKNLPLFKNGYTFTSKTIGEAVSNNKKGYFGGKSDKEKYLDYITEWASKWQTYKCDISTITKNKSYINLSISEKVPATPKKLPAQPGESSWTGFEEASDFAAWTDEEWETHKKRSQEQWDQLSKATQDMLDYAHKKAHEAWESEHGKAVRSGAASAYEKAIERWNESAAKQGAGWEQEKGNFGALANAAVDALKKAGDTKAAQTITDYAKTARDWTIDKYGKIQEKIYSPQQPGGGWSEEGLAQDESGHYTRPESRENPDVEEYANMVEEPEKAAQSQPEEEKVTEPVESASSQLTEEKEAPEPENPFDY